jgi:hypothetical protein
MLPSTVSTNLRIALERHPSRVRSRPFLLRQPESPSHPTPKLRPRQSTVKARLEIRRSKVTFLRPKNIQLSRLSRPTNLSTSNLLIDPNLTLTFRLSLLQLTSRSPLRHSLLKPHQSSPRYPRAPSRNQHHLRNFNSLMDLSEFSSSTMITLHVV